MSTKKKSRPEKMIYKQIDEMSRDENSNKEQCSKIIEKNLKILKKNDKRGLEKLKEEANDVANDGRTILHKAIMQFSLKGEDENEKEVISLFVDYFPKLVLQRRANSWNFHGQTPLHIAVAKGASWVVDILLEDREQSDIATVLETKAIGPEFRNTVMMAELPLSVAALRNDKDIFQKLLQYGARLDAVNSRKDNVCHCLIRHAYLYPDKWEEVLSMLRYINDDDALVRATRETVDEGNSKEIDSPNKKLRKKVWFMKNKEDLNPLQLAARFGQHEIFRFIMEIDGYRYKDIKEELFDIKVYDVTEIDAISFVDPEETNNDKRTTAEHVSERSVEIKQNKEGRVSVLRRLLELDPKCAFQFIDLLAVRRIIDEKWMAYRRYFYPWFIVHVIYISFLTWYATHRSLQNTNTDYGTNVSNGYNVSMEPNFANPILVDKFSLGFGIINLLMGLTFLIEAGCRYGLKRMPMRRSAIMNPYSNLAFRFLFIAWGISLISDFFCAAFWSGYENYFLMLAVFIGWFLVLFFLRVIRPFSYFTVMIQNVLIGDMLRFSVVIICELICFSTLMFMAIQGASEVDFEYSNYGRVLLSMFKLMVGLGDVGLLYQTRHPVLAILILIAFIILTTLLMVNSLIAMISRTSTELVEETAPPKALNMLWQLQRLSMVLYIESVLPTRLVHLVGVKKKAFWYSNQTNQRQNMHRRHLEIKSLLNAVDNNSGAYEYGEDPTGRGDSFWRYLSRKSNETVQHADDGNQLPQSRQTSTSQQSSLEIYNRQMCIKCEETKDMSNDYER